MKQKMNERQFPHSLWGGVPLLAVAYSLSAYVLFQQSGWQENLQLLSLGFVCLVPFAAGGLVVWFAPQRYRGSLAYALIAPSLVTLLFMTLTAVLLGELWVCVLIASPIGMAMAAGSGGLAYAIRRRRQSDRGTTTNIMVLFLLVSPFVVTPLELRLTPPTAVYQVSTQIQIDASPDEVWAHIIRVPAITAAEQAQSLFHLLGVPQPIEAQLISGEVGGLRYGRFAEGLLFVETITAWEKGQHIAFDIEPRHTAETRPPLRQIGGQVYDIHAAAYTIEPLAQGGVILHLDGTYRLISHFNGYGRLWMDVIMRDFQNYVLRTVQQRAEAI